MEQSDISGWVEWVDIRGFSANNLALSIPTPPPPPPPPPSVITFINICVHIKNPDAGSHIIVWSHGNTAVTCRNG